MGNGVFNSRAEYCVSGNLKRKKPRWKYSASRADVFQCKKNQPETLVLFLSPTDAAWVCPTNYVANALSEPLFPAVEKSL